MSQPNSTAFYEGAKMQVTRPCQPPYSLLPTFWPGTQMNEILAFINILEAL
jgi:hypothetical protein